MPILIDDARSILEILLSSEATIGIVCLFRSNPDLVESRDQIALRMGKIGDSIESDLKQLLDLGILSSKKIGNQTYYAFKKQRDKRIQDIIKKYILSQ